MIGPDCCVDLEIDNDVALNLDFLRDCPHLLLKSFLR